MLERSLDRITGTVRDATGTPLGGLTVIAFSSDEQYWRAAVARDSGGADGSERRVPCCAICPPGDYNLAVVDDVEQGEWFDPSYLEQIRPGAKRISLSEGEKKTQDLRAENHHRAAQARAERYV